MNILFGITCSVLMVLMAIIRYTTHHLAHIDKDPYCDEFYELTIEIVLLLASASTAKVSFAFDEKNAICLFGGLFLISAYTLACARYLELRQKYISYEKAVLVLSVAERTPGTAWERKENVHD